MLIFGDLTISRGRVISDYAGDSKRRTLFPASAKKYAANWATDGVDGIIVNDLDGSRAGAPAQLKAVREIAAAVSVPVLAGGGIADLESAEKVFAAGVAGVVIGSASLNLEFMAELIRNFGTAKIIAALDGAAAGEKLVLQARQKKTELDLVSHAKQLTQLGISNFIVTDTTRAGTASFPNFEIADRVRAATDGVVIARGGIANPEHAAVLARAGIAGLAIGRALLDRSISIGELRAGKLQT